MKRFFDTHYYRATKLLSSIVGLWPYQKRLKRKVILSFNLFVLLSYLPPQLTRLYQVWGKDIDIVCMCMPPLLTILICTAKTMTIIWFDSEMKTLLCQIETKWIEINMEEENKILTNYASKTKTFCIIYAVIMYNGLMCFIVTPMISPMLDIILPRNETRVRSLGFDLDYGVNMQTYWFWLWLHTCVAGTMVICNIVGADVIYVTLTVHASCLFEITRNKLRHMTDLIRKYSLQFPKDDIGNSKYNIYQCEESRLKLEKQAIVVRECVLSHKKAIEYTRVLQYIYAWCIFFVVILNLISISISAVQLVSKMFRWTEMTMSGVYIIGELMHLFFLSLMAQFILDQSLNVHESAYSSAWYNLSTKFQRDFVLILIRSNVQCQLTIGNMFVLSLETFCMMLQTSLSYFTMLVSFR
ncbi:odorant receptor 24a-like [Harpegnathos saltator]|uniref:odorant receptor 24a-like n=1 Tax=Harpegnathos saltator TaxID=610380 RepID=UPI000948E3D4|nr:odorant receptor 24a-like [Harpegnathos saltator]